MTTPRTHSRICPYCGAMAKDVCDEIDHMQAVHPDVVRGRLRKAGIDPSKEPTFVIKAKDALAIPALRAYALSCMDHGLMQQHHQVCKAIAEIKDWQHDNIDSTKLPDHQHERVYWRASAEDNS